MPLSRAFLSLGISSELRLFCSVIPTPQAQVVVGPVLVWWQRGQGQAGVGEHSSKVSASSPTSVGLQRSVRCPSGVPEG